MATDMHGIDHEEELTESIIDAMEKEIYSPEEYEHRRGQRLARKLGI